MQTPTDQRETTPDGEPVLDAEGHFHAVDAPIDISHYGWEDWFTFVVFWLLALDVFYQFFTRYVLQDSAAWTEEIARYLLIVVVFVGASMGVRRNTHIHVEFLYVYLPRRIAWVLSVLVDLARIAFLGMAVWLGWTVTEIMQTQRMVIIDWPMSIVFGACTLGLAIMAVRAVQAAVRNWRAGTSPLLAVHDEGRHQ